jgi:hypothetical protein
MDQKAKQMSNLIKKELPAVDNFGGWNDGVEGHDRPQGAGVIQGGLLKFSNEATWVTRDDDEIPTDIVNLVVVDVARVVQRWESGRPIKTIILEPHQNFPDIEMMNEEVPREQWVEGPDGHPRGPWQAQHILYLVDLETLEKYTYPTGTAGGVIAVGELVEKLVWMRRLKGPNVYPAVVLTDTFMKTRFGGRQRPYFKIVRWVRLGGEGDAAEALPPPPTTPAAQAVPLVPVQEPSLSEEMNDSIDDLPGLGTAETTSPAKKPAKASNGKRASKSEAA